MTDSGNTDTQIGFWQHLRRRAIWLETHPAQKFALTLGVTGGLLVAWELLRLPERVVHLLSAFNPL